MEKACKNLTNVYQNVILQVEGCLKFEELLIGRARYYKLNGL